MRGAAGESDRWTGREGGEREGEEGGREGGARDGREGGEVRRLQGCGSRASVKRPSLPFALSLRACGCGGAGKMTALDAMNGSQHWSTEPGDPHLDYTGFVSADNGKVGPTDTIGTGRRCVDIYRGIYSYRGGGLLVCRSAWKDISLPVSQGGRCSALAPPLTACSPPRAASGSIPIARDQMNHGVDAGIGVRDVGVVGHHVRPQRHRRHHALGRARWDGQPSSPRSAACHSAGLGHSDGLLPLGTPRPLHPSLAPARARQSSPPSHPVLTHGVCLSLTCVSCQATTACSTARCPPTP